MLLNPPKTPKTPKPSTFNKVLGKNQAGFTLLELIVVASIVVVLLVLVLTNFRGFEHKSVLDTEADKLTSVLRQAQIYALTGQTISGNRYNYGVHVDECTSGSCIYVLFSDLNDDKFYDAGEEYGQASHQMLTGVYIDDGDLIVGGTAVNTLDIVFEAPLGDIYFNDSQPETATIILKHTNFSGQKTITVNRISGQIDIQ